MWTSHPEFPNVVKNSWAAASNLIEATKIFENKSTTWNKETFGNIFHQKKTILSKIRGIHNYRNYPNNDFLLDLEHKLVEE